MTRELELIIWTNRPRQMTWYIHKGEDLKRDHCVKFEFYHSIRVDCSPEEFIFNEKLSYSEADTAPTYPEDSVKTLCKLRADLRQVDKSSFEQKQGPDGKMYFRIHFDLVVSTATALLKFSFEIGGKEMGSAMATYV